MIILYLETIFLSLFIYLYMKDSLFMYSNETMLIIILIPVINIFMLFNLFNKYVYIDIDEKLK